MSGAAVSPEVCPGRGEAETSAAADDDEPRAPRPRRVVVHATAVAWHGRGVLLRGPSGSGKSALALRLLHAGAVLVADDLVALARQDGRRDGRTGVLVATPVREPGLIEARGLGIYRLVVAARGTPLDLLVDLVPGPALDGDARGGPERLPSSPPGWCQELLGVSLPAMGLEAGAPDAAARILLALAARRAA